VLVTSLGSSHQPACRGVFQSARDKKHRLSGASVAGGGTPNPSVVRDESDHYDARRHRSPSIKAKSGIPGSLVRVQTARLFPSGVHSCCPLSCTTRMPCHRVMRANGQRATAAPVGRLCHLEVVHASDVLDDAVACVVPDVHADGEVVSVFIGAKSDSTRPCPALFIRHLSASAERVIANGVVSSCTFSSMRAERLSARPAGRWFVRWPFRTRRSVERDEK
jgi:hypothetical protein